MLNSKYQSNSVMLLGTKSQYLSVREGSGVQELDAETAFCGPAEAKMIVVDYIIG